MTARIESIIHEAERLIVESSRSMMLSDLAFEKEHRFLTMELIKEKGTDYTRALESQVNSEQEARNAKYRK